MQDTLKIIWVIVWKSVLYWVIGFLNRNNLSATKIFETKDVIEDDSDEIDMVLNIGTL